jgi:predicted nucleotidyltransferase
MPSDEAPFSDLESTLKKSAAALRDANIPFLLGGSLASWARGGPETRHDLDLMIKEEDVERALEALKRVGMKPEIPPEDWLVKAWDGDVLVDLIHHPTDMPITDEVIARGEDLSVLSMDLRVMALEDVIVTKLLALSEHHLRYETLLAISRALREKIDWDDVRRRSQDYPFARAFFVMLEGLGIIEEGSPASSPGRANVRVLTEARDAHNPTHGRLGG